MIFFVKRGWVKVNFVMRWYEVINVYVKCLVIFESDFYRNLFFVLEYQQFFNVSVILWLEFSLDIVGNIFGCYVIIELLVEC